jgi:hypothetical protein
MMRGRTLAAAIIARDYGEIEAALEGLDSGVFI